MKTVLMAAVMVTSILAGSAHAVQEGGCILPPKKPKVTASKGAKPTPLVIVIDPPPPPPPPCTCGGTK